MDRLTLSNLYVKGSGIEIGALHFPWPMANGAKCKYVDRYPTEVLKAQYREHQDKVITPTDIIADGQYLTGFPDNANDFVIASHVFEHCENAILSVYSWMRKLKMGGFLLLAVPDKRMTFDVNRQITPFDHFVRDFEHHKEIKIRNRDHYVEYLSIVDGLMGQELTERVQAAVEADDHIHFHVFDFNSLNEFFCRIPPYLDHCFEFVTIKQNGAEVFVVLKKTREIAIFLNS